MPNGYGFSGIFFGFEKICVFSKKKNMLCLGHFGRHKVLLQKVFSVKKLVPYNHDVKLKNFVFS